jgi:hypothetical protein
MNTRRILWAVTALLLAALLVGAKGIVDANHAALEGTMKGQSATFYGH